MERENLIRVSLGVIYKEKGSEIAAASNFQEVIRDNPRFAAAYYALATLQDENSERVALCEQVIALQPASRGSVVVEG